MASVARKERNERDTIMAHAAILATKNIAHRDRICSRFGNKRYRVAVRAVQPEGMRLMRKSDVGHFLGVFHHYVKVEHIHLVRCRKSRPGRNGARTQCRHPIGKSDGIACHVPSRFVDTLQPKEIGIGFVMNRISLQGKARRMQFFDWRIAVGTGSFLDRRDVRRRLQKCQPDRFTGDGRYRSQQDQQCHEARASGTKRMHTEYVCPDANAR